MNLSKRSGWTLGTAGLCVALTAGSWFGLVAPERAEAAASREATDVAATANVQLEMRLEQLREDFANLPEAQAQLALVRMALPDDIALAQLVRDVDDRADDAGITLESITSGSPVALVDASAVVAPPEADAGQAEGEAGSVPAADPAVDPAAQPAADPSVGATDPAADGGTAPQVAPPASGPVLAAVPVVITLTGDFGSSNLFLKSVQADLPRALLVDSLALTVQDGTDAPGGTIATVITGRVFVFVDPGATDANPTTPSAG